MTPGWQFIALSAGPGLPSEGAEREHQLIAVSAARLFAKTAIIWTIGIIVVVVGGVLMLLGMAGHAAGGRRHYF
jgi:hypothetical protein